MRGAFRIVNDVLRLIGFQCKFASNEKDTNKVAGRELVARSPDGIEFMIHLHDAVEQESESDRALFAVDFVVNSAADRKHMRDLDTIAMAHEALLIALKLPYQDY